MYAGGSFSGIGGQERYGLAAIDAAEPTALTASVVSPNGGDNLAIGSHQTLQWSASGGHGVASVDLYLSRNGPSGPWEVLTFGSAPTGAYDWSVTGPATSDAYLRVDARDWLGNVVSDLSNTAFAIGPSTSVPGRHLTAFALDPLAPNPTRGSGRLSFAVPSRARVRIIVTDVQGRQVLLVADGVREPGRYTTPLDARNLRAGLYFVRLQSPGAWLHQRFVVVR